jgi:hypothetical protein
MEKIIIKNYNLINTMNAKYNSLLLPIAFFLFNVCFSQVGINNVSVSAELVVNDDETSSLPALELEPQTLPEGTAGGQLAVIDNLLYKYDEVREKWLSIENTQLAFGLLLGADGQDLEFAGDVEVSGPRMPFDGTITNITMFATGGQANKGIQLFKNDVAVPDSADATQDGLINLVGYEYTSNDFNLDFNAGDWFNVEAVAAGGAVQNVCVVYFVKWRK